MSLRGCVGYLAFHATVFGHHEPPCRILFVRLCFPYVVFKLNLIKFVQQLFCHGRSFGFLPLDGSPGLLRHNASGFRTRSM